MHHRMRFAPCGPRTSARFERHAHAEGDHHRAREPLDTARHPGAHHRSLGPRDRPREDREDGELGVGGAREQPLRYAVRPGRGARAEPEPRRACTPSQMSTTAPTIFSAANAASEAATSAEIPSTEASAQPRIHVEFPSNAPELRALRRQGRPSTTAAPAASCRCRSSRRAWLRSARRVLPGGPSSCPCARARQAPA